jgi:hypothetical protein
MSTPDFDSMSPEELMAWMESLARRQGADEGFTTDKVVDVPEIDPSTVVDTGPGYIPYGMDAEKWAQKQREEEERKAARRTTPTPVAPPVQVTPPPTPIPAPAPAQPTASAATPDFDSMSPEELMAWMESLARRQGVDAEQLTTSADMEVPEIDPATVADTGPGYIPYGMDPEKWAQKQREEEERKAARRASASQVLQPPPTPAAPEPVMELPPLPDFSSQDTSQSVPAAVDNPLAWLESLGSGGEVELPQLDLSALGAPLENTPALSNDDPMAWLESLSQGQTSIPALEQFSLDLDLPTAPPVPPTPPPSDTPVMGENPLEWLESLARRQGVDSEELTTNAGIDVPLPETAPVSDGPGYTEYTFESPTTDDSDTLKFLETLEDEYEPEFDSDQVDSASAWLDALASGQADLDEAPKTPDTSEIMNQLAKNQINPNDIENWMANLLEQGATRSDVPDYIADEDDSLVQAQLPDWLIEQVGTPPPVSASMPPAAAPLSEDIVEPPAVEMPDWLTQDLEEESIDFEDIFDDTPALVDIPRISTDEIVIDSSDPWVEAFEMERKQGLDDINRIPDWYAEKLGQTVEEEGIDEPLPVASTDGLAPASLPAETELAPGELQALPNWLADIATAAPPAVATAPVTAPADDLPDWLKEPTVVEAVPSSELPEWLREAGVEAADVPDWLKETLSTEETTAAPTPAPVTTAPPAIVQTPPVSPAIVPVAAAAIDVNGALQTARSEFGAGNIEAALQNYEAVVRANTSLEMVVSDLSAALRDETHKKNPAVYRVLGDGLMRQGKLQEALDTYRKALNLL